MGKSAAAAAGILIAIGGSACGGQSVAAPTDRSQLTPVAATSEWPSSADLLYRYALPAVGQ
jgi:hypothetical protein